MCLALAACGGEDPTPPGTTSGTGGQGGAGGQGGQDDQSGDGGKGGDGGKEGGGERPRARGNGEPCTSNDECLGGVCLTEQKFGWAGGYCSSLCHPDILPCEAGAVCADHGDYSICLRSCEETADCGRAGHACIDRTGEGALTCVGGCNAEQQCQGACNDDLGLCVRSGEVCDNGRDDDVDGLRDCEERDCAAHAACAASIAAACTGATDVSAGGTFSGTTEGGTSVFGAICPTRDGMHPMGTGMNERLFRFVAPARGIVALAARATEGDLDWYVQTSCADAATRRGCFRAFTAGDRPLELTVAEGDSYFVFIEGKDGADAAYALDVAFAAEICGDGTRVGAEECDDGNTVDDDACTNACAVNPEAACAAAAPIAGDAAEGDASRGTQGFTGSCGGAGGEVVYRYTPLASGEVTITATPVGSADVVLYARTDCADRESEIACADDPGHFEAAESIRVTVTEAAPIDIFVDSYDGARSGPFTLTIAPAE
ncbi:DUF4215 domain-containing protein [Sorangium sp. So ce1335]|uniref:DUF4215 domain-containing protein n=1 Tax=Sorangium sp. So ce1335 TaxID=3133335 RepID=UPI003F647F2F